MSATKLADYYTGSFRDPDPSATYDDCHTPDEIGARWREVYADLAAKHGSPVPIRILDPHLEDRRRAHCRYVREREGKQAPRDGSPIEVAAPTRRRRTASPGVTVDPADTMVCDTCGEDLPATKFPTKSKAPGVRLPTCRPCKKGGRA